MTHFTKEPDSEAAVTGESSATWLLDTRRRAEELDSGIVEPVPSMEVMRKVRMMVRSIKTDFTDLRSINVDLQAWFQLF